MIEKKNSGRIFFISRSYPPEYGGGGAIVRKQTVDMLRGRGYEVTVVLFTFDASIWNESTDVIPIELNKKTLKLFVILEHLGIIDDHLSPWINKAVRKVSPLINESDLIFATSGGELGCIKLGVELKNITSAKLLVNLHDPISHTQVMGHSLPTRFHVNRDKATYRYLSRVDAIVTSSSLYADELEKKLSNVNITIDNWYFGYIGNKHISKNSFSNEQRINIVYAGNMNNLQKPQILIEALVNKEVFNRVNLHFFGHGVNESLIESYSKEFDNIYFYGKKSQSEVHAFYMEHAHVGFMSLVGPYFVPFVPSKLYDYIKFGLPVIGYLPQGDASNIISENSFGKNAITLEEIESAVAEWVSEPHIYHKFRREVILSQDEWNLRNTSQSLVNVIDSVFGF